MQKITRVQKPIRGWGKKIANIIKANSGNRCTHMESKGGEWKHLTATRVTDEKKGRKDRLVGAMLNRAQLMMGKKREAKPSLRPHR